jgi:hypothetical protein
LALEFEGTYVETIDGDELMSSKTKTILVNITSALDFGVPRVVYDVSEGGDTSGRGICIVTVSNEGEIPSNSTVMIGGSTRRGAMALPVIFNHSIRRYGFLMLSDGATCGR